jgi:hypothetical protein
MMGLIRNIMDKNDTVLAVMMTTMIIKLQNLIYFLYKTSLEWHIPYVRNFTQDISAYIFHTDNKAIKTISIACMPSG